MKIYIVCERCHYETFKDYCDTLSENIRLSCITYDKPDSIVIDDDNIYMFMFSIPDIILSRNNIANIFLINTEQLTRKQHYDSIQKLLNKGIVILDYDLYQSSLTKAKNHLYLPYQYSPIENEYLSNLVKNTPKIYDVAFCSTNGSKKRNGIFSQLKNNGISVINVTGWKNHRDMEIAKAKILINIHYDDDYNIFEHFRCDRWVFAGMLVITENSLSDDLLDIKDLMIIAEYEKLAQTTMNVIKNYDSYQNKFLSNLTEKKRNIIEIRKQKCQQIKDIFSSRAISASSMIPSITLNTVDTIDQPTSINNIKKITYGKSIDQSIDVTQKISEFLNDTAFIDFSTANINTLLGDPYYNIRKHLYIYGDNTNVPQITMNEYNCKLENAPYVLIKNTKDNVICLMKK